VSQTGILSAIASPRRQEILRLVWSQERPAGEIHAAMPEITFGAVSLQLRALMEARLVNVRTEGRNRYYQANHEAFGPLGQMLERMWESSLWRLKVQAELEQSRRGPKPRKHRRTRS
jgi:DNA-binding transcriptional ArsR family regulator